jgi:hypothetical protein
MNLVIRRLQGCDQILTLHQYSAGQFNSAFFVWIKSYFIHRLQDSLEKWLCVTLVNALSLEAVFDVLSSKIESFVNVLKDLLGPALPPSQVERLFLEIPTPSQLERLFL